MTQQNLDLDKLREHLEKARTSKATANSSQLVVTREGTMRLVSDTSEDREGSKVDDRYPFATASLHQ